MAINFGQHSANPQHSFIGNSYLCPARQANSKYISYIGFKAISATEVLSNGF